MTNKKTKVINMVKRNGFISYKSACNMVEWDLHNLHSSFRESALQTAGLIKTTMNGVKGYTLSNKTLAVKTILKQRKSISIDLVRELTGWNSNVLGSTFRPSALVKFNIAREGNLYKAM